MIRAIWFPFLLTVISFAVLLLSIESIFIVLPAIAFLVFVFDLFGRMDDYHTLMFYRKHDPNFKRRYPIFLRHQSSTRCSREVMIAVCPVAADDYRMLGYRWYHFLPDRAFKRDSPFLKITFWRQLFGIGRRT